MPECICRVPIPLWLCKILISFECPEHGIQTKPRMAVEPLDPEYTQRRKKVRYSPKLAANYRNTVMDFLKTP